MLVNAMLYIQFPAHGKFRFCFLKIFGIKKNIFDLWLNLKMQNIWIQRADCVKKCILFFILILCPVLLII